MNLHIDPSIIFEDNSILTLARESWPKKYDVHHVVATDLFLTIDSNPMYISGRESTVSQTNPKSWGVICTARNPIGEPVKDYILPISVFLELPTEYIGNLQDVENTEE